MSTAAQRRLEAAEAAQRRLNAAGAEPDGVAPPTRARHVRTDPVRSTVDLPPVHHDQLAGLADEWSVELGLPIGKRGVTRKDVLEEMVALLLTDETVARRLLARLRERPRLRGKQRVMEQQGRWQKFG